jgi:hypothetical protein
MPIESSSTIAQQLAIEVTDADTTQTLGEKINLALAALANDLQRSSGRQDQIRNEPVSLMSSSHELVVPNDGNAECQAVSIRSTTGSTALNYHTLRLYRNGVPANATSIRTTYREVPSNKGGVQLGTCRVAAGDVLSIFITTTGAPSTLTALDLLLRCSLKGT